MYPCIRIIPLGLYLLSDRVITNQQQQDEKYLRDIRERIDYLGAAHRIADKNNVNYMPDSCGGGYGAPC